MDNFFWRVFIRTALSLSRSPPPPSLSRPLFPSLSLPPPQPLPVSRTILSFLTVYKYICVYPNPCSFGIWGGKFTLSMSSNMMFEHYEDNFFWQVFIYIPFFLFLTAPSLTLTLSHPHPLSLYVFRPSPSPLVHDYMLFFILSTSQLSLLNIWFFSLWRTIKHICEANEKLFNQRKPDTMRTFCHTYLADMMISQTAKTGSFSKELSLSYNVIKEKHCPNNLF